MKFIDIFDIDRLFIVSYNEKQKWNLCLILHFQIELRKLWFYISILRSKFMEFWIYLSKKTFFQLKAWNLLTYLILINNL